MHYLTAFAKKYGVDWDNPPPPEPDNLCGCELGDGCVGHTGWHWRKRNWAEPCFEEGGNIYFETYDGQWHAYERCPAYWEASGEKVDPFDRHKLMEKTSRKGAARKVKAEWD